MTVLRTASEPSFKVFKVDSFETSLARALVG